MWQIRHIARGFQAFVVSSALLLLPAVASAEAIVNPIRSACNELAVCIQVLVRGVLGLVGVVALAFLVYGGFLYITAAGNEDQLKSGKNAITGAIIGIIVIGLAYAIVEFVARALGVGGAPGGGRGGI